MIKNTLLAVLLALNLASDPAIQASKDGEQLRVSFDSGAFYACTYFKMVKATETNLVQWPDGRYSPHHCWFLEEGDTFYDDDWKWINPYNEDWEVYAEVGYPTPPDEKGVTSVNYVKSNTIILHR